MNEPRKIVPDVEIYTATQMCRGDLIISAPVRLLDVLNDESHHFLRLVDATLANCRHGICSDNSALEEIVVHKRNIIALVQRVDPLRPRSDCTDWVAKIPQRVMIYAPPLGFTGDLHHATCIPMLNTLESSKIEFIPITDVAAWWSDSHTVLGEGVHFVAINREWITMLHPVVQLEHPITANAFWGSKRMVVNTEAWAET